MVLSIVIYQQRKKIVPFLLLKIVVNNHLFRIGIGSSPLPRKFHEGHNDTYCDLPKPFFLDEFGFTNHPEAKNWPLMKLRVKIYIAYKYKIQKKCHAHVVWICINPKNYYILHSKKSSRSFEMNWQQIYRESSFNVGWMRGKLVYACIIPSLSVFFIPLPCPKKTSLVIAGRGCPDPTGLGRAGSG